MKKLLLGAIALSFTAPAALVAQPVPPPGPGPAEPELPPQPAPPPEPGLPEPAPPPGSPVPPPGSPVPPSGSPAPPSASAPRAASTPGSATPRIEFVRNEVAQSVPPARSDEYPVCDGAEADSCVNRGAANTGD